MRPFEQCNASLIHLEGLLKGFLLLCTTFRISPVSKEIAIAVQGWCLTFWLAEYRAFIESLLQGWRWSAILLFDQANYILLCNEPDSMQSGCAMPMYALKKGLRRQTMSKAVKVSNKAAIRIGEKASDEYSQLSDDNYCPYNIFTELQGSYCSEDDKLPI